MPYQPKHKISCVNCGKKAVARKLCGTCYTREKRRGTLNEYAIIGPEDVFWDRVDKTDKCWLWTGGTNEFGYGIFMLPGEKQIRAHRYAFEDVKGPIPEGMVLMHHCDVPSCVNPDHLSIATRTENNRDAVKKRRHSWGTKNGHTRLTEDQVRAIRRDPRPQREIAKDYAIDQGHVSAIVNKKAWRCLG